MNEEQGPGEVLGLADELREIKELLRDISREVTRIERRAEIVFPKRPKLANPKLPALDEASARQLLAQLTTKLTAGEDVDTILRSYKVKPDLQMVASVLGMTNTKLPPKAELVKRISTRLRQSSSVKTGIMGDGNPS